MKTLDQLRLLKAIPEPGAIKRRLVRLMREGDLLRGLLRLSQRKQQAMERERIQGATPDAAPSRRKAAHGS